MIEKKLYKVIITNNTWGSDWEEESYVKAGSHQGAADIAYAAYDESRLLHARVQQINVLGNGSDSTETKYFEAHASQSITWHTKWGYDYPYLWMLPGALIGVIVSTLIR